MNYCENHDPGAWVASKNLLVQEGVCVAHKNFTWKVVNCEVIIHSSVLKVAVGVLRLD